ncbi:MAG: tRNA (adenosine(37)-N6)-threonylcarbamoyltransferase complex ATPase subunit type 1 TsaE [Gemmatimonadetes bacterium]|nr:tRNA (adenosine(37)-N6)-threonylcarbamoyltransferase complex ATPase subunit type 1 TsaE [Gemmatimonadota bacterium]
MKLTEDQLTLWGRRIGREVDAPLFIGLRGPLGAGKSVFARAVAHGAGVDEPVPSPTFNVLFRYEGAEVESVVHADLYRLDSPSDLVDIGWEDILADDGIVLVEWPERAGEALPSDRWEIELGFAPGEPHLRVVSVRRYGSPCHLPGFPVSLT